MAAKKSAEGFLDKLLNVLITGKSVISSTVDDIEVRVTRTVQNVVKASVQYLLFLLGFLFVLVGLSRYIQAHNAWVDGMGFMVVGGALVVLVWLVRVLK